MLLRKFDRDNLDSEPEKVLYKDIYPWDEIEDTPFGASMAIIEPGGATMLHSHEPSETFIIFQGSGTISIDGDERPISAGDVVSRHLLQAAYLVQKGAQVTLHYRGDGFAVSTSAIAQSDGVLGERISVQNISSGKVLDAIVTAENNVESAQK